MDDPRPQELLESAARVAHRLGLRLSWTDGVSGPAAKACSRAGSANWKNAKPFSSEEGAAVGFFVGRARRRSPVVPAVANTFVIVEVDLDVPDDAYPPLAETRQRVAALMRRLELVFPRTVIVRSRRGLHFYFRPPPGCGPCKVQLAEEDGEDIVTVSSDGYVVGVPGLHELPGVIYEYVADGEIATLPREMYDRLVELGAEARRLIDLHVRAGQPIPTGQRNDTIFHLALARVRAGKHRDEILAELRAVNHDQCRPALAPELVAKQIDGAFRWAAKHPTESERASEQARRVLRGEPLDEPPIGRPDGPVSKRRRALLLRPLRAVVTEPVEFAIDKQVPLGAQTLLAGIGGLGKSGLLLAWTKQITDAGANVLIVSYEDAAAQVLRPRFEALGGDLDRLFEVYVDVLEGSVSFPTDLGELDRHVRETQARAVLIDPVSASIDLKLDAHKDQDVRVVLGQLAHLAERERLAIVMNAHLNKAPSADPYLRINGSTAFYNAARSVLTVTRDPAEPDEHRLVAAHKSNYGPLAAVERWRIVPRTVFAGAVPMEVMTMEFVEIAEEVSRDDVLAPARHAPEKLDLAVEFLEDALDDGEWHDSAGLKDVAARREISERTLKRAAQELDAEHERRGFPSTTWWRLPQSGQPSSTNLGPAGEGRMDTAVGHAPQSSRAKPYGDRPNRSEHRLSECRETRMWLARDGVWRCNECEPPAFPGEILEERSS